MAASAIDQHMASGKSMSGCTFEMYASLRVKPRQPFKLSPSDFIAFSSWGTLFGYSASASGLQPLANGQEHER